MSNAVAKVVFIQGQAWAKAADGTLRPLQVGSALNDDELLLTAQDARVVLDPGTGETWVVNGGIETAMNRAALVGMATDADRVLSNDARIQKALTVLEQGGDLLEALEETAAGITAGGGNSDGHKFVQLTRVLETTESRTLSESNAFQPDATTVEHGTDSINLAPVVTDQVIESSEDVSVSGQIIARDVEKGVMSFSLATPPAKGVLVLDPVSGRFTYTPEANDNGTEFFIVTVTDSLGKATNARVTLNIAPVNDAPTASAITLTTEEDVPVNGQLLTRDIENDTLTAIVSGLPAKGTVVLDPTTGAFVYTPTAHYNGSDSFTVTVSDGNGGSTTSLVRIGVTPVNDEPATADLNLTTDEDSAVNGAISANDPDGDDLSYTITARPANGSVVLNPATGAFTYTPNAGYGGSDTFAVTVSDGQGGAAISTVTIDVHARNDNPVASDLSLKTAEDTAVNGAITAMDPDNDPLSYSMTGAPANGTVLLNPSTGTFVYTPDADYSGNDSFVVSIHDGQGGTTSSLVRILVTPENDPPITVADRIVVNEGSTAALLESGASSVLANDSDAENTPLSAVLVSGPAHGTLTLNANGTFSYTHDGSETRSDSFTYRANDGSSTGNTVTVHIAVSPVNEAPVATNDSASVDEGGSVTVAVRTNDSDPEGDPLTVISVSQGANGSVVIDAVTGNPVYTPNAGFSGNDSFTYTVKDPSGETASATVTVEVKTNAPSVLRQDLGSGPEDYDVTGNLLANDTDPDDTLSIESFQVTGSGRFNAGQTAFIAGVGSLVVNTNGSYAFDPVANWNGAVPSVSYTTNTGASSTLEITVTPVADAPLAADDFFTIHEDDIWSTPLPASDLRANDTDPDGDALRVTSFSNAANGTLSVVGGNLVFTPNAEFSGTASFDYFITDDKGGVDKGSVFINVLAVDDPTQAIDDIKTVAEGNNATGNVLANDIDPDTRPQVASFVILGMTYAANERVTLPNVGEFTLLANGDYSFEPIDNNFNGAVPRVSYTTDTGASADLNITLTPVNDAPVAVDDTFTVAMNSSLSLPMPLAMLVANDTDVDQDALRVTTVTSESNGTLQVVAGNLVFTPTAGFTGLASFNYIVTDDKGGVDSGRVTINVLASPNQAPETHALNVTGDEDTLITINLAGNDSDGSVAGYRIKSLPANGLLYGDPAMHTPVAVEDHVAGPVYFKPAADWNGLSHFDYSARDNQGLEDPTPARLSITIDPVADTAVLGSGTGSVKEDTPAHAAASGTLTLSDPDQGEAAFIAQTHRAGTYGHLSINRAGDWVYDLDNSKPGVQALKEGETKTEQFTVASMDGTTTTVTVTVNGTNDDPLAIADTATVKQGNVLSLTPAQLLGNDTDIDGNTLSISSVQGAINGTVNLVGGNIVFNPTPEYSGPASFSYTLNDGQGGSSTATVSLNVLANTAPDAGNDPEGISVYSVAFGDMSSTDNWSNFDSKGLPVNITAYTASGVATGVYLGTVDGNLNTLGVQGTPRSFSDGPNQIEYNIATDSSESVVMRFNGNLNQARFGVSRLFPGDNGSEIGQWEAYFNNTLVQSDTFRLQGSSDAGSFSINTGALVFNSIKFSALHTNDSTGDGSDYFLTSFSGSGPASLNSSLKVLAGTSNTINASTLLANDIDADGDRLTITSVQAAVNGTVSLARGHAVFTPTAGYTGPASFTYTISDGYGGTDTATVILMVERANSAAIAVDDKASTAMDRAITIATSVLLSNDSDPEGDSFTLVSVQGAVNGSVSLAGANVIFTPTSNYEGPAGFTYTIRDALGELSSATVNIMVGSASAPSLVVSKSLLAIAQGTNGTSVKFPVITSLVDVDGSESMSVKISGVPTSLSFNAGTNLGGGVWQFVPDDLPNLILNLPGSYTTLATNLTVQATSTEMNGGATASVSSVVTLKAAYTTVDQTTTESGSYTGSSANEFIQGGNGNNTINGSNGNNFIHGGSGDDNLSAGSGSDIFFGASGNDTIHAGSGSDRISGGAGNDLLKGGDAGENFVDVFVWSLGDQGAAGSPATDTIQNFVTSAAGSNTNGGDVLDLRDLLQGEHVGPNNASGNLADYLHFEISGNDTIIHISHTGGFSGDSHTIGAGYTGSAETQNIILSGADLQSLYSGANTDHQIITQLLNNNKLITD